MKIEWILCPFCGSKTRLKIRYDTVLENFPLYCPKCKHETLITVSAQNQPAQLRFFSFPIGRGRLSSYIEIKKDR